jgi:hypothetical protein
VNQLYPPGESLQLAQRPWPFATASQAGCSCEEQCLGKLQPDTRVTSPPQLAWPDLLLWAGGWRLGVGY